MITAEDHFQDIDKNWDIERRIAYIKDLFNRRGIKPAWFDDSEYGYVKGLVGWCIDNQGKYRLVYEYSRMIEGIREELGGSDDEDDVYQEAEDWFSYNTLGCQRNYHNQDSNYPLIICSIYYDDVDLGDDFCGCLDDDSEVTGEINQDLWLDKDALDED